MAYAEDLITTKGKKYKNIEIMKVNSDSVSIIHKYGAINISFLELTPEFLKNHPEVSLKANAFRDAEEEELRRTAADKAKKDAEVQRREEENRKLLTQLFAESEKCTSPRSINGCMVLFEGSNGGGSGFKLMFGKLPVIVTNAHVFFEVKNAKIKDIDNNTYEVEHILASKTRDLVIVKFKATEANSTDMLLMDKAVGSLPLNMNLEAYGNSLAQGVITILTGDLLGLGPNEIEISAPIVPGNSGGPVLNSKTKEVIGVSTYMRFVKPRITEKGSRFAGENFSITVRRFATRIDNLTSDDLQILFMEEIAEDQNKIQAIAKVKENIEDLVDSKKWDTLLTYCRENSKILDETKSLKMNSAYLQRCLNEWRGYIGHVFEVLGIVVDKKACMLSLREKVIVFKDSRAVPSPEKLSGLKGEFEKISSDQRCKTAIEEMMKICWAVSNPSNSSNVPAECFETTGVTCRSCSGRGVIRSDRGMRQMPEETPCNACSGKGKIPVKSFSNFRAATAFGNRCSILIAYLNNQLNNL